MDSFSFMPLVNLVHLILTFDIGGMTLVNNIHELRLFIFAILFLEILN
jgi:hypothetical protein